MLGFPNYWTGPLLLLMITFIACLPAIAIWCEYFNMVKKDKKDKRNRL